MPVRLCADPTCAQPASHKGRCLKHLAEREQRSRPHGYHVYRCKRWAMLRKRVLFEQPLCPGWQVEDCGRIATEVDHIVALAAGGQPYARANVQALCSSCHGRKTSAERAGATPSSDIGSSKAASR